MEREAEAMSRSSCSENVDQASVPGRVVAPYPSQRRLPQIAPDGVSTVFDYLCHRFPRIPRRRWQERIDRGLVLTEEGPVDIASPYVAGMLLSYYREIDGPEPQVRTDFTVVYRDRDLLVVDKPHFLPVIPTGPYLHHCLLSMVRRRYGGIEVVPLHRIDAMTAGLVAFSLRKETRKPLTLLFRPGLARKEYLAVSTPAGSLPTTCTVQGIVSEGDTTWRRRFVASGPANSATRIRLLRRRDGLALFQLYPRTGKTHQLRLHLASLGAPILGDCVYRDGLPPPVDIATPLQLLALRLAFRHPLTGERLRLRARRLLSSMVLL